MKINKKEHKALLFSCFFEEKEGQRYPVLRTFQIDKLKDAASAAKKLRKNSQEKEGGIFFADEEVEFNPSEIAILKDLFDKRVRLGFTINEAEAALEVKDVFEGKLLNLK